MILEALAGVCTPASGAQALGIRLPRYYFLEQRAIRGLGRGLRTAAEGTDGQQRPADRPPGTGVGRLPARARERRTPWPVRRARAGTETGSGPCRQNGQRQREQRRGRRPADASRWCALARGAGAQGRGDYTAGCRGGTNSGGDAMLAEGGNSPASRQAASLVTHGEQGGNAMSVGRKPKGIEQVELLTGSPVAKQRLEVFLASVAGRLSVAEACAPPVCKRRSSSSCGGAGWKGRWSVARASAAGTAGGDKAAPLEGRHRSGHDGESVD